MSYYGQAERKIFFDDDPMQGKSIGCQYLVLPDKCRFSTNAVFTRRVRGMIRAPAMRIYGEVRVRGGGI